VKNPKELAKLIITAFLTPTACFIAIAGSLKGDGSQVVVAVAMVTLLGGMWGFPTKDPSDGPPKGGSHAA
jgi:hypothetical protein